MKFICDDFSVVRVRSLGSSIIYAGTKYWPLPRSDLGGVLGALTAVASEVTRSKSTTTVYSSLNFHAIFYICDAYECSRLTRIIYVSDDSQFRLINDRLSMYSAKEYHINTNVISCPPTQGILFSHCSTEQASSSSSKGILHEMCRCIVLFIDEVVWCNMPVAPHT
jgi:hypothetical protein